MRLNATENSKDIAIFLIIIEMIKIYKPTSKIRELYYSKKLAPY